MVGAVNPVQTGTAITDTWANTTLTDIAAQVTNSLAADGQTTPSADITLGGHKLTNVALAGSVGDALSYGRNATVLDLTSTGNTILGSATGNTLNVGAGGIIKDASGNVGIGAASSGYRLHTTTTAQTVALFDSTHASKGFTAYTTSGVSYGFVGNSGALITGGANTNLGVRSESALDLSVNAGTLGMRITAAGVIQDGGANELGFKGLPAASVTTGAFAAADRGKCVFMSGAVTVPNSTMAAGDVVYLQDETGSAQTITASIATLRRTGTTLTGNRTLAPYGRAAIVFKSSTLGYISGDVT